MKPLIVTLGDPAGIGPEVVLRALESVDVPAVLCGSWEDTLRMAASAGVEFPSRWSRRTAGDQLRAGDFLDVSNGGDVTAPGMISAAAGRVALDSIETGIALMQRGEGSALVTAPVNKEAISRTGAAFTGHTELLAERTGRNRYGRDFAMMFDSPELRVVLLSVHVPLAAAIRSIDPLSVCELATLTDREMRRLGWSRCRIGVAAINPHAGEGGLFGTDEAPLAEGVRMARERGLEIGGPYPADTIFHQARKRQFDVVIAVYHDQGLIAIKTLAFEQSVNVTIGLPWLRVSVDHGTAFDIAWKGMADPAPMEYAIRWAAMHAETFR